MNIKISTHLIAGVGLGLGLGWLLTRSRRGRGAAPGRPSASSTTTTTTSSSPNPLSSSWAGKVVIVTGGASGIGAGVARAFHARGAQVWVADVDAASGRRLAGALGPRLRFLACNASDEASIAAFCARVLRDGGGRLDCLVNNVGVQCDDGTPAHELPTRVWAKVIAINLTSYFLFARACLPALMETAAKGGGGSAGAAAGGGGGGSACIINMSSVQGLQSQPGIPAYAASKGGILSLTRQMSMDYASKGVRVVAINPGTIRTPLVENLLCGRHGKEYLPEALRKAGAAYPMGRIGEIEEIAETAVFLAGGGASFITGESVTVDGGIMAMGGWAGTA